MRPRQVLLMGDWEMTLAEAIDPFDALLDSAVAGKTSEDVFETVEVLIGEQLVEFRFREIDPRDWARATMANPPRTDLKIDLHYGYNLHGACEYAAVKSGRRVDGDTETALTAEQWAKVFTVTRSGKTVTQITDAIWKLNEWLPSERLALAKKASAVVPVKKRRSPAS